MTRKTFAAIFVAAIIFAVPNAFAQSCETDAYGPFYMVGGFYYLYEPEPSCFYVSGGAASTDACYSYGGWQGTGGSWGVITHSFTAETALANWSADAFVEFSDPNGSGLNWADMWIGVTHDNSTLWYPMFRHDGTEGAVSCARLGSTFSAEEGDLITVEIRVSRYHNNAMVEVARPFIFTNNF